MGQDELWDSVKKAAKSSLERFDNLDKNYIGMVWIVGGSLASRVACELVVVLFRINETLHVISDNTKDLDDYSNNESEKNLYKR